MAYYRVIDFHSHVLPGIDDGSKDVETSLAMLRVMREQNVDICVATPHFYGDRQQLSAFLAQRSMARERLSQHLESGMPQIVLGAEVAFFMALPELDGLESLCIDGTRTLLLEMPFAQWTNLELDVLTRLCLDRDYQVILAHMERYLPLQRNKDIWEHMMLLPVTVQLNAECLLSPWGRGKYLDMFRAGRAHLLGSDCHNLKSRAPNLGAGRRIIEKKLGAMALLHIDDWGSQLLPESTAQAEGTVEQ